MDSLTSEEGGEIENVDAIKKFIEAQEKEIQDQRLVDLKSGNKSSDVSDSNRPSQEETSSVCSSVIEMVINESELEIARKGHDKSKDSFSPADKVFVGCGSMSLSVGSKVEAKDFSEDWHPAEIIEVDYDDMEVLVHYEHDKKRSDEWINVSSPRLRPLSYSTASSTTTTVLPGPSSEDSLTDSIPIANLREDAKESKLKLEEKEKLCFQVGERCLARWRDNRRFVATVLKDLGDGKYEILFDDGCHWTCNTSRLYKLRSKKSIASAALVSPSPFNSGPSTSNSNSQYPTFHTHLFDPTRDYLGSKSERREMKRKLNIKEIFNIGQKKARKQKSPKENTPKSVERKPRNIKKRIKLKLKSEVKFEPKSELPAVDAVASIIGTIQQEEPEKVEPIVDEVKPEVTIDKKEEEVKDISLDVKEVPLIEPEANEDLIELEDLKVDWKDPVLEEEVMLEQFEKPDDSQHEEVLDRIKEVINKLEDGIQQAEKTGSPKPEPKEEIISPPAPEEPKPEPVKTEVKEVQTNTDNAETSEKDKTKKLSKVKKGKKLKLLREKKVKIQVEKVRNELEMMKKQMSEMRKQMLTNRRGFNDREARRELPESFMLPGEWCCRWVNGQPVGTVSEIEAETKPPNEGTGKPPLPRRSVQVEDKRLPEGWTKHMVRRSFGHSAGKWDVVLISPDNRRFHTKNEVRTYLDNNPALNLEEFSHALTDFGVHLKLSRRMGWISYTPDGTAEGPASPLPAGTLSSTSPLVKRKKLTLRKEAKPKKKKPKQERISLPRTDVLQMESVVPSPVAASSIDDSSTSVDTTVDVPPLEDGYVFVGSLKVQVIDNLLRCPADNCFKNFRNNTLLQMHIKHYHRELKKMMGATPKVLDLAYARTMPLTVETPPRAREDKIIKVKIPRPPKREEPKPEVKEIVHDLKVDTTVHSPVREPESIPPIPKSQDSPKLRQALINKPVKRPKVLLPVRRPDPDPTIPDSVIEEMVFESKLSMESPSGFSPLQSTIDFDSSISSHTVTKPLSDKKRKVEKKKKTFAFAPKMAMSEEDDWSGINSDLETRSSFPRSETPEKYDTKPLALQDTLEEPKPSATRYMYENGERIKLVRMKREEIINCHCGFREEDGLMVQCELCLCWQHALCHNIQRESEVPEKYTCSICVNPRRGRRSMRFVHQQARLFDGQLAGARPCDTLRRSHELAGNLLRVQDALHALRVKYYVATKKDHPKLYLWAEDWEKAEIQYTQEKLNSDYSDLNIVINSVDKENLPVKHEEVKDTLHSEEHEQDRYMQRDNAMGSQALLSSLMSSPGAESLDLPISTSELERLAKSVQEQEVQRTTTAPEPEAAIENSVCRERLLKHVQRCQALIDARLESIEAQVAELESQSPSLEDDETAEHFPRTKQTIQMLMRDLETMEELGVIT
ncbi:unnamed protein product [Chrysodeixis includens]|uniref:Uncharacterized protein n=1 Tax=Chrysodeixis includens TaxID=689277 RepID=A0A9N8KPT5_CHRIL|nr:unnamed protein product [Chrysodeixis includens]